MKYLGVVISNRRGFTVLEVAIVFVIIGILLGAIVKGQEMIKTAKIKRLYAQQKELSEAIYAYFERYTYYPGDDPNAYAKWPVLTTTANGNGNSLIAVGIASTAPNTACSAAGTEQCNLWGALRQAGLYSGNGFAAPRHIFGGSIAVTYYNVSGWTTNPLLTHWIAFRQVPTEVAQSLDIQYDDGNWQTGNIRAGEAYSTTSGAITSWLYFKL